MISHVSVCLLAHEKMLDFKHFLSCKTGVQLFGSSDRLYSRFSQQNRSNFIKGETYSL